MIGLFIFDNKLSDNNLASELGVFLNPIAIEGIVIFMIKAVSILTDKRLLEFRLLSTLLACSSKSCLSHSTELR